MEDNNYVKILENIEIDVDIFAIILGADKTLLNINIGNGYTIKEVYLEECRYKEKIIMGDKSVNNKYFLSQQKRDNEGKQKVSFICITKEDKLLIPSPSINKTIVITDKPMFENEMQTYKDIQFKIIDDFISKMMLFKEGDIGIYEVFFNFEWQYIFINSTELLTEFITDANTLCTNTYTISETELETINIFLVKHNQAFELLKKVIDCFTYSYKLLYDAKAFEQLITALEILFLKRGQKNKKETLSKRIAVFLAKEDTEILDLYNDVKSFYKYRSEYSHEGIDFNITRTALLSLREYTRRAIKNYLHIVEDELLINPSSDYSSIKNKVISQLLQTVTLKIGLAFFQIEDTNNKLPLYQKI